MPKVSIIMGVYNNAKTLSKAVMSILDQSYTDIELIACDDASKDNSFEILQQLKSRDQRLIVLKNDKNLGHPATLNKCVDMASGKYIARMDADDFSMPDRIALQLNYLDQNADVGVLGTTVELVNENYETWGIARPSAKPTKVEWAKGPCVFHPTVMMRKDVLLLSGKYDDSALFLEDYELWMRMVASGVVIRNLDMPLLKYKKAKQDFKKQRLKYRLKEVLLRFKSYKAMKLPAFYFLLALKPIMILFIPRAALYHVQRWIYSKSLTSKLL